jgi:hypothetical protein
MAKTNDFTNFANERPNYFPGQYLLEDDFELQHKYLSDRQRYYNQSLHISGIIEGLEVEVVQGKKEVQIKSGSAIDVNGNLIVLKTNITFSNFNNINEGLLYIQYAEEQQNQQQKDIPDSYTRLSEKPILGFASQIPENIIAIKLAKLTINQNPIVLDNSVREYSGLSLPNANSKALTLRSAGNANPNLAVLTGSLQIDENLTVNGTISGKIDAISITTGQLDTGRIPNLSADKIISGTLSADRIPNLSADKITSGTIAGDLTVNGAAKLGYESNISDFGIPLMSGFYQNNGQNITGDVPDTSHLWTHLINARHSNTSNNHQLQIASSYQVNDRIFFRKIATNGTSNPTWNEVATRGTNVFDGTQTISGSLTVNGSVQLGGFTDGEQDEWPKVTWYRDPSKNWDEGLIKNSAARGVFKKAGYGIHFHQSRQFSLWSTNWDALFAVEGQTGNTYVKGNLTINSAITPSAGSAENNGIMFPKDPGSGTGDAAWIRYYSRNPSSANLALKEQMTLEIGTSNDPQDHIALMASGGVGIGTNEPAAKLDVNGYIFEKLDVIQCNNRDDWGSANHPIKVYFQARLAGKPVGTMMRAIQDNPRWRGHYWQAWVDADRNIRVIHNYHNTGHLADRNT